VLIEQAHLLGLSSSAAQRRMKGSRVNDQGGENEVR
jgi:hypothetical protein